MLCAGITTYAALRKSNAKAGDCTSSANISHLFHLSEPKLDQQVVSQEQSSVDSIYLLFQQRVHWLWREERKHANSKTCSGVVVAGAGGGLGHIACQLASRGMGFRVVGIDAPSKKQVVMNCGAEHFIDLTAHDDKSIAEEVVKLTDGLGANAVIVCTASNKAYAQALDLLRFNGTLVCVGMPEGAPEPIAKSFPQAIVFKQANIVGVAVGSRKDAIECLDFAARGIVKTHFRTEKMDKLTEVRRVPLDLTMWKRPC